MDIKNLAVENPTMYAELLAFAAEENKKQKELKKIENEQNKILRTEELAKEKEELAAELATLGITSLPEAIRQVGLQEVKDAKKIKVISRRVYVNFEMDEVSHTITRSVPTKGMTDDERSAAILAAKRKIVEIVLSILS
jgi:hypothetical protein